MPLRDISLYSRWASITLRVAVKAFPILHTPLQEKLTPTLPVILAIFFIQTACSSDLPRPLHVRSLNIPQQEKLVLITNLD